MRPRKTSSERRRCLGGGRSFEFSKRGASSPPISGILADEDIRFCVWVCVFSDGALQLELALSEWDGKEAAVFCFVYIDFNKLPKLARFWNFVGVLVQFYFFTIFFFFKLSQFRTIPIHTNCQCFQQKMIFIFFLYIPSISNILNNLNKWSYFLIYF